MRQLLLFALIALSGCTVPVDDVAVDAGVPAAELHDRAFDLARGWNPDAQLWGIATFDMNWSATDNRMARHYDAATPGDGLAHVWTFSFRAYEQGILGQEATPHFVIHLDSTGDVLSAYETDDDDEGAMGWTHMTAWDVDSDEAAAIAKASTPDFELLVATATEGVTSLQMMESPDGMIPAWQLTIKNDARTVTVAVDAQQGHVLTHS